MGTAAPCCKACMPSQKQLAVLQGEVEGLVCKVNGFERALQDCEMELAERNLQVALLQSFIKDLDSPTDLQANFHEVLQHNNCLQQRLQELTLAFKGSTASCASPSASVAAVKVSLLRAALTEANYRLAAAGLPPVAATSYQESGTQELGCNSMSSLPVAPSSHCSNPAACSTSSHSHSRLFRTKYSTDSSVNTAVSDSTMTPPNSTSGRSSPCAPALCLLPALSSVAAASATLVEGPDTPQGLSTKPPAHRPSSWCPEARSTAGIAAATTTTAAAAANTFIAPPSTHNAAAESAGGSCMQATRSASGFEDIEPYPCEAGEFSDSDADHSQSLFDDSSKLASHVPTCTTSNSSNADRLSCSATQTCSPWSTADLVAPHIPTRTARGGAAAPFKVPDLLLLPDMTCSCDNPLFAADDTC